MATKTSNYEFNKPEQNDFYDVDVQNENWDKVDEELSEFDDSGVTEDIKSFPDFLSKFVTGNKVAITLRNLKAGLQFVLHAGQIVNNCVTDNAGLPLSAAQGKALMDKYTQLYSETPITGKFTNTTPNNLSNRFSSDSLVYNSIDDIPKSGSCFGTISKSIKIGTITIPAYSRFSFINTGTSTDGALFAIDSNGYSYTAYRTSGVWNKCFATATKDDLNTVLMYRGVITGDLNRGRNLVIAPGIYSIQSVSTITNGPSDFGGWGIFVQFPDNLFSQMILNSPNYIKFRKYSGQNPSWGAW